MPRRQKPTWRTVAIRWATNWKIVSGVVIGLGGVAVALPRIEPYVPAHRQFVRDADEAVKSGINKLGEKVEIWQTETQIDATRKSIAEMRSTRAKWVLEFNRTEASAITKGLAEQQITEVDANIQALTDQLRSLQRKKSQHN